MQTRTISQVPVRESFRDTKYRIQQRVISDLDPKLDITNQVAAMATAAVVAWPSQAIPAQQPSGPSRVRSEIVADARRHGVDVRPIDVLHSDWNCTLEEGVKSTFLRLLGRAVPATQLSPETE